MRGTVPTQTLSSVGQRALTWKYVTFVVNCLSCGGRLRNVTRTSLVPNQDCMVQSRYNCRVGGLFLSFCLLLFDQLAIFRTAARSSSHVFRDCLLIITRWIFLLRFNNGAYAIFAMLLYHGKWIYCM